MIVMNKPGASGAIGWADVINGKPDGYKVALLATDLMTQPNMGFTKITYEDFTPIARLNYDPAAITVRADAPWNTVEEFIAAAKKAAISRSATAATARPGTSLRRRSRTRPASSSTTFPYSGAAPAALALLGGHIDAITVSAAEVYTYVASGKLKTLAVMSEQRIKGFEKVPTLKERGMDISIGTWRGLAVAKGTPPDVVAVLSAATEKIAKEQSPARRVGQAEHGLCVCGRRRVRRGMAKDHAYYKSLITKLGIKP